MASFEALILKQIPFKESSKILHVYTAEGMKSLLVHGAKKLGSPYLSASENLNLVVFHAVGKEILTVTDADLADGYPAIKADLVRLTCAQHLAELVHGFGEGDYDHAKFFAFVKKIMARLAADDHYLDYLHMLELKYLHLLGVAPAFSACAACGRTDGLTFRVRSGGLACPDHAEGPAASDEAFRWLRTLYLFDLREPLADHPSEAVTAEIRRVLDDWYAYHLNFRSKSRSVLSGLLGY
ncbi:MAG: DNA repair protein RecO [Candidatus Izemoplasmatales bacterium]